MMRLYPIQVYLESKRCVVVGGGKVAERKVIVLLDAKANVALIAPEATPTLQKLADEGAIEWTREPYASGHLDGAFLVMACTDNPAVNAQVTQDALARNLLVLCADHSEAGNFVSPAAISRGELMLTVSTGGNSPTLAAVLRERLDAEFGPEWDALTTILGRLRETLQAMGDEAARKAAIRRVLADDTIFDLLRQGNLVEAETRVRSCLFSSSE